MRDLVVSSLSRREEETLLILRNKKKRKTHSRLSLWLEKHFDHASEPEGGISRPILKENVEAIVKGNSDLEAFK